MPRGETTLAAVGVYIYMRWPLIPVSLGVLAALGCQPAPQVIVNPNATQSGLTVSGTATVRVKPTLVVLRLGANFTDGSIKTAKSKTETTIKAIAAAVSREKIAPEDVQTTSFRLNQTYLDNGRRMAWNCQSSLEIRVKDIESAPQVLEAALAAGANQVQSVEYTVEELQEVRAKARDEACQVAQAKADQYGRNFGVKVGKPISISETTPGGWYYGSNTMAQRMSADMPAASAGDSERILSSGSVEVQLTVNVNYSLN